MQRASLFKCERVGRFRIPSIFLLTMANENPFREHACQNIKYF